MLIKSIHIENFGKLSDHDITLSNGINAVCEQNGYGKSTIAAFIKAMFYGLDGYTTKTKDFVERMHFYPFNGMGFGGNIVFEFSGNEYRIERSFDEKSAKKDTLTVYRNGNVTEELGDVPGVKVFGINKESFERLLCADHTAVRISAGDDINKKLNNYVDNVNEDFDISKVIKTIGDTSKKYKNMNSELEGSLKEEKSRIENLKNEKNSLSSKYDRFKALSDECKKASDDYNTAQAQNTLLEKWKTYDHHIQQCELTKKAIKEIEQSYPESLPTEEELKKVREELESIRADKGAFKAYEISPEEQTELAVLKQRYKNGIPLQSELDDIYHKIIDQENAKNQLDKLKNTESKAEHKDLDEHFHGKPVSDELIMNLENEKESYDRLNGELQNISPKIIVSRKAEPIKVPVKKLPYIVILLIAVVLILSGIIALSSALVIGIICIAAGGVLLLADMFAYLVKSMNSFAIPQEEPQEIANPEFEAKKAELSELKNKMLLELANYRYNGDDPVSLFYKFKTDSKEYERVLSENADNAQLVRSYETKIAKIQTELDEFFAKFDASQPDFAKALDSIKSDINEYENLEKRMRVSAEKTEQLNKSISRAQNEVKAFQTRYMLPQDLSVDQMQVDVSEHQRLTKELERLETIAEKYKLDNSLDKRPESLEANAEELFEQLREKTAALELLREEISALEDNVSELDSKLAAFETQKNQSAEIKEKIKLYDALKTEILKADQSLKDRYVKPIRDKFCYYAKLIEDAIGQKVSMDKDYKISFDIQGKLRSYEHLSSGSLAVCALCFRLAVISEMFENEQPFLILDDPFMPLDKTHFEKTKVLLEKLAEDKQIIYFCCHESRMI